MTATRPRPAAEQFARGLVGSIRRRWSLVLLLIIAMPYFATVTLIHTEALSPVDEWVYVDYLRKLPSQGMVHEGELVGLETLRQLACDGVSPFGPIGPPCGSELPVDEFPNEGLTSAAPYTPIYFAMTRAVGDALAVLPGVDQTAGWRLTGTLWAAAAIVALYALARDRGVRHGPILAVGIAFVASPFSWWTYSYVSTDAPGFALGALLLLLALRVRSCIAARWWMLGIAALAVAIKLTNLLGVALATLLLLVDAALSARRRAEVRPPLVAALFPVGGLALGLALQSGWLQFVAATAVSDERADQGIGVPLTLAELFLQVVHFLPAGLTASPITAYVPPFAYAPLGWLTVAGVLAAAATARSIRADSTALVVATVIGALSAAPLLAVTIQVFTGGYFQLPPRYAATLLPAFLLVTALVLRQRTAIVTLTAYGVALLGLGLWLADYFASLA